MSLRDQGIEDDNVSIGRERRAHILSDHDGGVGRGRGIYNVYKGLKTATEAAGARRRARGIYNNNGCVDGRR